MKKLLIVCLSMLAMLSISSQAMAADEAGLWEQTKHGANVAVEWSIKTSSRGWQATKSLTAEAADWTAKKSGDAWQTTKQAASSATAWAGEKGRKGWESVRNSEHERSF